MRAVIAVATVLAVGVVVVAVVRFNMRAWARDRPAGWVPQHRTTGQQTVVSVELRRAGGRLLDAQEIAAIPVTVGDYDARFLEAMARARERAAVLQSEADEQHLERPT